MTRPLHPLAWWLWGGLLAAAAVRTSNIALLGVIIAVAAWVVVSCRTDAPWSRAFGGFLRMGLVVIVIRVVVQMLFGQRLPGHVLFTLPSVELPSWMAGVTMGGPVTVEDLVMAFGQGLRLAAILACVGAANSLANPWRLLRCVPSALYETGVAVGVALTFAPRLSTSVSEVREARRLRGRATSGVAGMRGIAVPVLEGALDRSVALAASMDARGYGRHGDLPVVRRRVSVACTLVGLTALAIGVYGVLDTGAPSALGLPAAGVGAGLVTAGMVLGSRSARTRYRPDPWRSVEWVVSLAGAAALVGFVIAGRVDPSAMHPTSHPLSWPTVPLSALVGLAIALVPSVVAAPASVATPLARVATVER